MLTIQQMEVAYKEQKALLIKNPITFADGDRIGIIGSNGAGKSTLIHAILGLIPYKGSISTNIDIQQIAVHLQFNEYSDTMPVRYIMETILNTKIKNDTKLQELIAYFEFEDCLKKKYSALSGGQKQRLTIIMVLMQDAPLTFFDEVTSGLDFETRQRLMEKLESWYEKRNNTLCIVSHYYEELERLVSKLLILDQGCVIAYGEKEQLFKKYCGKAVLIVERSAENEGLLKDFRQIEAQAQSIAIPCETLSEEEQVVHLLLQENINFRRSDHDIEMIFLNAKKDYYDKHQNMERK